MVNTPCKNFVMFVLVVFKLVGFEICSRLCLKVPFGPGPLKFGFWGEFGPVDFICHPRYPKKCKKKTVVYTTVNGA